eukprot:NODE_609_length_6055_cov_0.342622.p1 type:complete len:239 gc:universal NODE_609_length_6055_cov_0.342622:5361-4645(-)
MVFYFTVGHEAESLMQPATVYMGRDKFENEILMENCCEYDIWFHVDHLSSAHVYLQSVELKSIISKILSDHYYQYKNFQHLPFKLMEQAFKDVSIPDQILQECGQLVKGNSIKGSKEDAVDVIYTPCWNLKRTKGMETGSVLFMKNTLVKKIRIERDSQLLKKLCKTRIERNEDYFKKVKSDYYASLIAMVRNHKLNVKNESIKQKELKTAKDQAYVDMFDDNDYRTNKDGVDEDDFM